MTNGAANPGHFPSPSHRPVVGRRNPCHCKALFGLDYNMAQAWLAGEATCVCEGCSKTKPKGGDGESVTPGAVCSWAITGTRFDAEAADNVPPTFKAQCSLFSITTLVPVCKPLVWVCPWSSAQGLRYRDRSLGKAPHADCELQICSFAE